jgi:hypothetical protein
MSIMTVRLGYRTVLAATVLHTTASAQSLPSAIQQDLPQGFEVQTFSTSQVGIRQFYIVALKSGSEAVEERAAPSRPLLIFGKKGSGPYVLLGRNDQVILRRDEGGASGCDPFEDSRIAVKGSYFSVEQGIACGRHGHTS